MSAVSGVGGSPDAAGQPKGRLLRGRPRGRHVAPIKKIAKRAKRLQEVPLTESDGARILGRRIKVFWRDENKWFYGVVKAYNRGRKSHKIVYDDKEEEWLKLHEEKFKLQVLDGEVFGTQEQVVSRQFAVVTGNGSKISSSIGKSNRVNESEHLNGEIAAASANGGIQAIKLTSVQPSSIREGENGLEYPGFCSDGDCREQGSSIKEAGFNVRAVEEFEGATPMVFESVDIEDPYAIDHTSISDSLVMFMRSKQSLADSRKVAATSGAVSSVQPVAVAANPTEVSPSLEPSLCNEAKDKIEISDVSLASSEARDVFCDLASSERCTFEERGAPEGISCEDGKGSVDSESLECAKGGDVDSTTESVDLEDPYAIDHTSISDSLGMFMRSKQSLAEPRKVPATSEAVPSVQPAAVAVNPIEVSPSVEPPLCNEVKDEFEISDVARASSDACDAFCDLASSEGCFFEREAPEGISCEDGKGFVDTELLESTKFGGVDATTDSAKLNAPDFLGSSDGGGLHWNGLRNVDHEVGEDVDLSKADMSPLDVVLCDRAEEDDVRLETKDDHAHNASDDFEEFGNRAVKCTVCREVGSYLGKKHWVGSESSKGLASKKKSVPRSSPGSTHRDIRRSRLTWLVRTERYISRYIATNLVKIDCTIPGH